MKKILKVSAFVLALTAVAVAGSIKTWGAGETVTASDLNTVFQHIHNTMVGGHGARLVNADVNASAAISHSKMATPTLIPKAMVALAEAGCGSSPCTMTVSSGVTSVTRSATGRYMVNLSFSMASSVGALIVTPLGSSSRYCKVIVSGASAIAVDCYSDFGVTLADSAFSFVVLSN